MNVQEALHERLFFRNRVKENQGVNKNEFRRML